MTLDPTPTFSPAMRAALGAPTEEATALPLEATGGAGSSVPR